MNDNKHARLSPSSAHRWMECPGSVTLESEFPQDKTSEFAEYGTAGHMLGEMCLTQDLPAKHFKGKILNKSIEFPDGFEVDDEMVDAVQMYADYCNNIQGTLAFIENKVDFSEWVPEGFGTSDYIKINTRHPQAETNSIINVVDLKMGKGVKVHAKNNPQGMLYALGVISEDQFWDDDIVNIVIVQPRLDHISEWEISVADLLIWAEQEVRVKASAAWEGKMEFNPGEKQCRFCKASATCTALANQCLESVQELFSDISTGGDLKQIHSLSNSDVGALLGRVGEITNWVKSLKAFAFEQLEQGNPIEGYKLVLGRSGNRKWTDENSVETVMKRNGFNKKQIYNQTMVTPAVAEKMLKAKNISTTQISHLWNQPEGKLTITDSADPKEEVIPLSNVFGVIGNNER